MTDVVTDEYAEAVAGQPDNIAPEITQADAEEGGRNTDNIEAKGAGVPDLGMILDIPVMMSLEVGSTEITVNELLSMGTGAVVELNRHAGDPLDVKVNGKLLGRGEVVETNGRYGIRLTEVVSPSERLGRLS